MTSQQGGSETGGNAPRIHRDEILIAATITLIVALITLAAVIAEAVT